MITYMGEDIWVYQDTVSGKITYQILENHQTIEFDDLTACKRHICYSKLQERQREQFNQR